VPFSWFFEEDEKEEVLNTGTSLKVTDFRLSLWLAVGVDCALGFLHRVDEGSVWYLDPEDGGSV
jgi:hypothetical protein